MKQVLPEPPVQKFETRERINPPLKRRRVVESLPTAAVEISPKYEIEDDVEVSDFGEIASRYLNPYLHNARFLDKHFGIRREDDGMFMIGDSVLPVDDAIDISIKRRHLKLPEAYGSY